LHEIITKLIAQCIYGPVLYEVLTREILREREKYSVYNTMNTLHFTSKVLQKRFTFTNK